MKKILLAIVICFTACKKEKLDVRKDNRFITTSRPVSTARIVNLAGYNQVIANGKILTDTVYRDPQGPDYYKFTPTVYFPKNGQMGSTWQIPQELFGADNNLELKTGYLGNPGTGLPGQLTLSFKEVYNKPMDYYLLPAQMAEGLAKYAAIERGVAQPSKPDYIKIRIINLSAPTQAFLSSPRGPLEDLTGPVSLAYADGRLVSDKTSNVTTGQRTSEYVEVPYGTYQFKVLTADGRQIPGVSPLESKVIDPPTSTISLNWAGEIVTSNITFAPIMTYQPGGVYTIVVTPYNFNYLVSPSEQQSGAYQNAFRVITDLSTTANTTYCRIQGVNALPGGGQISFRVGGKVLSSGLNLGEASAYTNFIQGDYKIEAVNSSGTVLASLSQTLRPAQNYTVWLYPDAKGVGQLVFVPNDLSGVYAAGISNPEDASLDVLGADFMFSKRFLNLSPDNPYITFTFDNGQQNSVAAVNLKPGIIAAGQPYVGDLSPRFFMPYEIMAYRSAPEVVPGTWAKDIEVLRSARFIAREALYQTPGRELPAQEPGIYTVALIGRSGSNVPAAEKAKLIVVKHNR
jgi:hypothetical protein